MLFAHFAALVLLAVQSTPRPVEGLMNGDFELLYTCPGGAVCGPSPIDGGFWVGAEGKTLLEGSDRIFRLKAGGEALVYQNVGCATGHSSTASLDAQVRVSVAGDEAWLTVEEGGEDSYPALSAVTQCNPTYGPWAFFVDCAGTLVPTCPCPPCGGAVCSFTPPSQVAGWARVEVGPAPLIFEWTAPKTGNVRITLRAPREDASSVTVTHDILMGTSYASASIVRTDTLAAGDNNGKLIQLRTSVTSGDKLFFRASISGGTGPAVFEWHPLVAYEGRRLTYRFSTNSTNPSATAAQKWIHVPVTAATWKTVSNQAIGADFNAQFGAYPKAPLHIELGVPGSNANRCDFDDLSCTVDYDSVTPDQLRDDIIAEAQWSRDLNRMRRDRDTSYVSGWSGPGPWKLGGRSTPYQVHAISTICGPHVAGTQVPCQQGCVCTTPVDPCDELRGGTEPLGLWTLLSRVYDDVDYEDYFWIRERERRNVSSAGLLYTVYDTCADAYTMSSSEQTDSGVAGQMVELYERTNDPSCLQIAVSYADVTANNGVFNVSGDVHNGMLVGSGYNVATGANSQTSNANYFDNLNHFGGAGSLLSAYVACKKYNAAHPSAPIATSTQLANWLAKAKTSVEVANQIVIQPNGQWVSEWYNTLGIFNDYYGYLSSSAVAAARQLEKLATLTTDEQSTLDTLRTFVRTGADYFLPRWEQQVIRSEKASGDNARSWPSYMYLRPYVQGSSAAAYEAQVLRAGQFWTRFQFANSSIEGVWVTANENAHQIADDAGHFGTPTVAPAVYPWGISYSFLNSTLSSTQRDDLIAILNTVQKTTIAHYKQPLSYGYQGFAFGYLNRVYSPLGVDQLGGFQQRFIDNYLFLLDQLPGLTLPQPPTVDIKPGSLITPASGGETFVFTIHVPTATTQSDLQTALDTRTKVARWAMSGTTWQRTTLWPDQPSFFNAPTFNVSAKTATLTAASTIAAGAGEFKFEARTWDAKMQWARDTSYQQNW